MGAVVAFVIGFVLGRKYVWREREDNEGSRPLPPEGGWNDRFPEPDETVGHT